jgi:N6-L-threonylcarbamoyladenine synthase
MLILGVETSCDETAAAVLRSPRTLLANVIHSQLIHEQYGGVVPELASREHVKRLMGIVDEALSRADCTLADVDAFAVTYGPGLVGALLVGLTFAKSLAQATGKPFIGVNHLEGHIFSNHLSHDNCVPPFVALIVSGGHSNLVLVKDWGKYQVLGKTRDDAPGEAFDKIAKILGLTYPGGPAIEKASQGGDKAFFKFPRAFMGKDSYEFSFSGLKTAVAVYLRDKDDEFVQRHLADISASFQEAICEVLATKAIAACREHRVTRLSVSGGVAMNKRLRELTAELAQGDGIATFFPGTNLSTDNAAMIAMAGAWYLEQGITSKLDLNAVPYLGI